MSESEIILVSPDPTTLRAEITPVILRARDMVVVDIPTHRAAEETIASLTRAERQVRELFAEPKRKAHEAHKAITTAEKKLLDPLSEAKRIVAGKADTYEREQRRIAEAEQRRLEAVARAAEEERLLAEAAAAEDAGDIEEAEAILVEAETAPTPVIHVAPAVAKIEGTSKQERWHAEIVDLPSVITWVAEHLEFADYLLPNMPGLNARARSAKGALNIPGVRAVCETVRAVRS